MIKGLIFDFVGTLYDGASNRLYDDTIPALTGLKGKFSLILVTDASGNKEGLIRSLGIYDLFDNVIVQKKGIELFQNILQRNNLNPSECLVIGDGGTNELDIADKLNIKKVMINRSGDGTIADGCIANLAQVRSIIESYDKKGLGRIIDQKNLFLSDGNNRYKVNVYLKEVLVRNNYHNTKAFCRIIG